MNIKIVPSLRIVQFDPDCASTRSFCHAVCCSVWDVFLTAEEHASGKYEEESICLFDGKLCTKNNPSCFQLRWRLKKKQNGACVYLGDDETCTNYEERLLVCRKFTCAGGWKLDRVVPPQDAVPELHPGYAPSADPPVDCSQNRFMVNPAMALKTLFLDVEKKSAVLIVRPMSKCQPISLAINNIPAAFDESALMALYEGFSESKSPEECAASAGVPIGDAEAIIRQFLRCRLLVPVV